MVEKIRFGGEWGTKKIIAVVFFAMIIVTFVLVGPRYGGPGEETGSGVAAVVNDVVISTAEYRQRTEQVEQSARQRFEGLPEAQRRMITQQMRRSELERLIAAEAVYQAAVKRGVLASDAEVKAQLLQIPILSENGRFQGDRYRMLLEQQNISAEDFERRLRKDIVLQKVFALFNGAATGSRAEAEHERQLQSEKINVRFVSVTRDDLKKLGSISESEVAAYLTSHKKDVETYYKENLIEFTKPDLYHAHDVVIRIDEKRKEADAQKKAEDVRRSLTPATFAKMAKAESEDPGSKAKGGDLGELEKGALDPEFESAVLKLKPNEISAPLKIGGAFHVVWLESKKEGHTQSLEEAQKDAAKRLLAKGKEAEVVKQLSETVEKGTKKDVEALLAKANVKWQESGEFSLASATIPKLGDPKEILPLIMKQGKSGGLIKKLVETQGNQLIVEVTSWKTTPTPSTSPEQELASMVAYKKSEPLIEDWAKEVQAKASVQRNNQLLR